ncbi:MAG: molybdopterin molybdotransferase MoeA [Cycloclasticus sp.]|nr:molybdopterin molybdotransferase MoeA [Cycloclasticus sp.]MBQ0790806.1 molybdopterin molybdotransferase MoeA [Cycloclasticus sp.]
MTKLITQSSCDDENELDTLSVQHALQTMLDSLVEKTGSQTLPITDAVDRVLAKPITATINVPSHCNSAVDGYALMHTDLPPSGQLSELTIVGQIVAGHPYTGGLKKGECIQIMTGAQMPVNADTVIMQEQVEINSTTIRIDARHSTGQNVRQAGEDIQLGQTVLSLGVKLTPPQIGLIASLGIAEVSVKLPLVAAIFSTGDEVLNIADSPKSGCIYDSNRYSLLAALKKCGCQVLDMGIIPDDAQKLRAAFELAAKNADVIFTSGGVSVGAADYTKQVLSDIGSINFWKVAMKPGRPLAFGHIDDAVFFGLPGNPVAVMVTFYQFALPCLAKILGLKQPLVNPIIKVRCSSSIRKLPGRTEFQRGVLSQSHTGEWSICTTGQQGSGILRSMSEANAFIILEHDRGPVKQGDWVNVQAFSGLF